MNSLNWKTSYLKSITIHEENYLYEHHLCVSIFNYEAFYSFGRT